MRFLLVVLIGDFDVVQLMTVSVPEIKMAANFKTKPEFLWLNSITGLMFTLCDVGVSGNSKMAAINRKYI